MSGSQQFGATYTWSTQGPPPTSGQFRGNSSWSGLVTLYFSNQDNTVEDVDPIFSVMAVGDTIRAEVVNNTSTYCMWSVTTAPVQNADMTWTVGVSNTDQAGGNPANGVSCNLVFTVAATPSGGVATWTYTQVAPTLWRHEVDCVHGATHENTWTLYNVQPQNVGPYAGNAYQNHQRLLSDCDCVLQLGPVTALA